MSNVLCSGNEFRLIDCPHTFSDSGTSGSLALLRCRGKLCICEYVIYVEPRLTIIIITYRVTCNIFTGSYYCRHGDMRLTGGKSDMEGRVEICTRYSRWGTVCNRQWTPSHTKVVCHFLGFNDNEGKLSLLLLSESRWTLYVGMHRHAHYS